MKFISRLFLSAIAAAAVLTVPSVSQAHSYESDDDGHPLRYIAYPVHAIGLGLEYAVTRPIHWGVSQCKSRYIFGHVSHPRTDDYWGDWNLYQRYSY